MQHGLSSSCISRRPVTTGSTQAPVLQPREATMMHSTPPTTMTTAWQAFKPASNNQSPTCIGQTNATSQATNDSISALTAETRQLSAALLAMQQQLAMFTRSVPAEAGGWPAVPAYVAPAAAAGIPPVAPAGRGRRGGSRRGGRRGRGGGRGGPPPSVPATIGGIPPPAGGIPATVGGFQTNKTKWHNNWNYCYSCGWDIPDWHTSATCPANYRKKGHQEGCTRELYGAYETAGHRPSKVPKHKDQLPQA